MKKQFFSALALFFVCVAGFCSCNIQSAVANTDNSTQKQEETVDPSYQPYQLTYESIGDGTCRLVGFSPEQNIEKDYILTVPEYSPAGERVIEVKTTQLPLLVPAQISVDRFEQCIEAPLREAKERGDVHEWYFDELLAHYQQYDLSEAPNTVTKANWLQIYPILQEYPIYVLSEQSSRVRLLELQDLILNYTDYTYQDLFDDYREVGYRAERWDHIIDIQLPAGVAVVLD